MSMTKMYASGELTTGEAWDQVPVQLVDKMAYERTARAQHWPPIKDQPLTFSAYVSYTAAKRAGAIAADMPWPAFVTVCLEAVCLELDKATPDDEDQEEEGPTQPGPSTP